MSDVIDDLKVQIDASTQSADAKLDKFIAKMMKFQSTITGLEMSNVSNIASGINQISASIQNFNNRTKTADFSRVATGMNKLATVDAQGVAATAQAMSTFAANMMGLNDVHVDSDGISNIANAISKLGRATVTEATQNLEFLKTSIKDFITGMNGAGSLTFDVNGLVSLVNSVSRLGSTNATQSVKNLPQISTALRGFITSMNTVGSVAFDFAGLNNLVSNITRLGGAKATQAATNLKPIKDQILRFVSGLNGIGSLSFDTTNLANLVSSITKLGGKAATTAIPNIQALGTALTQLMATLSHAPAVSQNLIQMTTALASLAGNGSRVSSASTAMYKGLGLYSSGAKSATKHSFSLAAAIGKVYASYWMLFRAFGLIRRAIDISSDLTEVQNVIDVSFGAMNQMVEEFTSNSIQKFGMSELSAKKMAGVFMSMGKSLGAPQKEMAKMSINLTKLAADMASFYNVEQKDVGDDLRSIFTGQTRPLRDYGLDITQANLQEFAATQGIDKKVAKMTQLEKVQLRYNYVMQQTAGIQGDYERTAGTWANQVRLLCQQFQQLGGIVGGTLINAFKPFLAAMNAVIAKVIAVAQVISDALGKIFGWKFETSGGGAGMDDITGGIEDASGAMDDFGDSTGGAADKVKKLAGNLQAFDKLNVVSSQNDSSGGGSGGGASGADASAGEWVPAETIWDQYKSSIDSLFELGEYIGNALTSAMNNIDWNGVYQGARNFGTGLASFLNGLISPELFGATGRTIAGCLNTALHFLDSFGTIFEWGEFGLSIATGINEFFNTFDFGLLAHTLNIWVEGLEKTIGAALINISWQDIFNSIGGFLSELELDTVLVIIGGFALKKGWLSKFVKAMTIGLAGGISLSDIVVKILSFRTISIPSVQVIGNAIINKLNEFIQKNFGESILNAMGEGILIAEGAGIGFFFGGPLGALAGGIIALIIDGIQGGEWATKFWARIGEDLFNWDVASGLWKDAKGFFDKALSSDNFVDFGINIVEGIINGIAAGVAWVIEPIMDLFDEIVKGICDLFGIHSPATEMEPYGRYILEGIIKGFKDTFNDWTEALSEWYGKYIAPWFTVQKWSELYDTIKTSLKTKWNETVGQWTTDISTWWGSNVSPWFTAEKWMNMYDVVRSGLKTKWSDAVAQWKTDISNWWENNVVVWFTEEKWTSALSGVKTGFENAFTLAFDAVKQLWNSFADWLNSKLTFDIEPVNIAGVEIFGGATLNLGKLPTFSNGGFPEDGLFMANHNELVGQFSNGRSVVANNEQITEGIAIAVQNANSELLTEIRRQNELLQIIANKPVIDKGDIVSAWKSGAKEYKAQTGRQLGISY